MSILYNITHTRRDIKQKVIAVGAVQFNIRNMQEL